MTHVAIARLRVGHVTTRGSRADPVLALGSPSFVLLDHQVNRLLCVVQVKLVVLSFLLLLGLLLIVGCVLRILSVSPIVK